MEPSTNQPINGLSQTPAKASWSKHLSWKIFGFLLTPIVGVVCFGYLFGYGFSGCRADIECAIVPKMLMGLFVISGALLLAYIVSFFIRSWNVKKMTVIYLILVLAGALILATFRYDGIAYKALHGTEFECAFYSNDVYRHGDCISAMAQEKNDAQRCYELPENDLGNGWWRSDCLTGIAIQTKNPRLCEAGDNRCVSRVAMETQDPAACDLIVTKASGDWSDSMSKEECLESVSSWADDGF